MSGAPKTLSEALLLTDEPRIITTATRPYRILHTNAAWSKVTGYKFTEAAGKTCSILQGPATEASVLTLLEAGIGGGQPLKLRLINYTADGKPFYNTLSISPLFDAHCNITNYSATIKATPIEDGSVSPVSSLAHAQLISSSSAWANLRFLEVHDADGVAAAHSSKARSEAANAIIRNHERLVLDITNPSPSLNIDGKPLTQLELCRLPHVDAPHVDTFLREVSRRLLGRQLPVHEGLEEFADPSIPRQNEAWQACHVYLQARLQSTAAQKPDREPDMSSSAAAAMVAVMAEVAGEATAWSSLREKSEAGARVAVGGAAAAHSQEALTEVARKLVYNRVSVLRDVTNPASVNIHCKLLTQQYLRRVSLDDRRYVDHFLQEVSRRLLGGAPQPLAASESAEGQRKSAAWAAAAKFLQCRVQSTASQKPGRAPDMSQAATAAFKAVLSEVAGELRAPAAKAYEASPSQRLKRTRNFADLHTVFNNEKDAIIFTEARAPYKITHVNKAWCDMCGYSMEEIEGATNAILQGPDTDMSVVADLMDCVRRSEPGMATLYNYKKGGERFVNQVQVEPVYDEDNTITQFMAILHEVDMMPRDSSVSVS
eukprot:CAMPEP_0113234096 /NCGR_PEP_ID=MMETSP0008_2-20120614/2836_1 /TAXON_ID=97485 /ORGANISM="Prymnesium parvum" /LENGTH=599 /DNA_ID=CAMNT_0000080925 /DNA_START=55 /DNA_END=1854 /DNA_ORIENTATION=- /assembly_acc=CAM_ASM_000153